MEDLRRCARCGEAFRDADNADAACRYHPGRLCDYDRLGADGIGAPGDFWDCCMRQVQDSPPSRQLRARTVPGCAAGRHAEVFEHRPPHTFWGVHTAWERHLLAFLAMRDGRREDALRHGDLEASYRPEYVKDNAPFLDAFMTVRLAALERFGEWQATLDTRPAAEGLPVSAAYHHFARGVALTALGRLAEANEEAGALRSRLPEAPRDFLWGANLASAVLAVGVPVLDGTIAWHAGRRDEAARTLREAVAMEDALNADTPPAWMLPARHRLGAVLVATAEFVEAEGVYREALRREGDDGWALRGLMAALEGQGRASEAAEVGARLADVWTYADVQVATSCLSIGAPAVES